MAQEAHVDGYENLTFKIKGVAPLIMHNGRLNAPLDTASVRLREATDAARGSKNNNVVARIVEVAHMEFLGSIYTDDDGEACVPSAVIEAAIKAAAKQTKEGKQVSAGLFCLADDFKLVYDGPKTAEELWSLRSPNAPEEAPMVGRPFVDRRRARVGQAAVMRTRPIFHDWELQFSVLFDPEILNRKNVIQFIETLGRRIGLCELRPRFGRFEVVEIS